MRPSNNHRPAPVKAVVFDLDGTLVDAFEDIRQALNHALRRHNLPTLTREETVARVGHGLRRLILDAVSVPLSPDKEEAILSNLRQHYEKHLTDHTRSYAGIPELLSALQDRHIRLAVLSNKAEDLTRRIVSDLGLAPWLDVVWGMQANRAPKPAPDGMAAILAGWGIDPAQAILVGDGETDMETARGVGCRAVACLYGGRSREQLAPYHPDGWIERPLDLLRWLDGE